MRSPSLTSIWLLLCVVFPVSIATQVILLPVLRIVGKIMNWVNKKPSPNAIYEQQQPINPKPIVATKCASERATVVAGVAHATPATTTTTNDSL
jgi:hypothetical protein